MPLLILAHSYPPVSHSGSQRPYRFAKYLGRNGRRVEVMTSTQFLDAPNSAGVHRVPHKPTGGVATILRKAVWKLCLPLRSYDYGMTWIVHSRSYAVRLAREMGPCCVLSTYPPGATHLTALLLKKLPGIKWIADFRDPLFDNPSRRSTLVRSLDRRLERATVRHADAVTVNTDHLADELRRRYPKWKHKITVLKNGYDPEEECRPLPIPPRDHRVLAHVGTIYGGRHPALLIESWDRLRKQGCPCLARIRLSQIGSVEVNEMPNRARFDELVAEGTIQLSGERIPRTDALRAICEADLLLVLDLNEIGESTQVPAKIFDYVRAGRPILLFTSRNSPAEEIVRNCGVPHRIVFRDDQPGHIDQQVREFLMLPSNPTPPSEWFLNNFDGARQAGELCGLIRTL